LGDIIELANHFLKNYSINNNISGTFITKGAEEVLINYNWPGNIRELKNVIETAAALSKSGIIDSDSIKPLLNEKRSDEELRNLPVYLNRSVESLDREMIYRALIEIKKDLMDLKQIAVKNQREESSHLNINTNEIIKLDNIEKQAIINAVNFTKHNKRKAAKLLGISERTLYRKLKEYGLD
jgi:DNA-binding NtrC family response regulator